MASDILASVMRPRPLNDLKTELSFSVRVSNTLLPDKYTLAYQPQASRITIAANPAKRKGKQAGGFLP
jgi:hypothetical protein